LPLTDHASSCGGGLLFNSRGTKALVVDRFYRLVALAEPADGGLGGADAVSAGSELPLEIGERDLPEFPLGPAIRCNRQSLWSV
jgi:hypothetical protein